ncbi:PD-(D/E)XK nuclease family protein [Shewanella gaetbuli]|uniref:PD-(D/E)XK nuclease family protein n=1 Tax=Shewanella gaetbuli TaxID=220752 RepID=A0A9X1ZN42_9GAMM|nr:PD-(D/E)XK nuclease family protein [Shewanella gaetbuli]MCL1142950.1 PD-(D/E)XK nuclease family protein [Shewanella gaetbuli]
MNFASQLQAAKEKDDTAKGGAIQKAEVKGVEAKSTTAFAATLKAANSAEAKLPPKLPTLPNKQEVEIGEDMELGPVDNWSFSALKTFENCQWAIKLQRVDKIPQQDGEAAVRGSLIHDGCEEWVRFNREHLPADNKTKFEVFNTEFERLRQSFREHRLLMEENWGIRQDWSPCNWNPKKPEENDPELWGKAKLDAFEIVATPLHKDDDGQVVFGEDNKLYLHRGDDVLEWDSLDLEERQRYSLTAKIIDYKTGRKFKNEMKHRDQGLSYALHAMHRYPDINTFHVEFWYLDQGEKMQMLFNRRQLVILLRMYHNRAMKMTTCKDFMPNPNAFSCQYCPYGANVNRKGVAYGVGVCEYDHYRGIDDADI